MRVLFRADGGGSGIGLGHLMRCLAVADALAERGATISFLMQDHPKGISLVTAHGYAAHTIPLQTTLEADLIESLKHLENVDMMIVDIPLSTPEYLKSLHESQKMIVAFDDKMDKLLPVNCVIGNAYADRKSYGEHLPEETLLLAGPEYLPLRKEFQTLPPHEIAETLENILICCGGEDPDNVTQAIVEALSHYPKKLTLHILIGIANEHQTTLQGSCQRSPHRCIIHTHTFELIDLLRNVDVAITAAGVMLWEIAAAGLPFVAVQIADNQKGVIKIVLKHGLGEVLGPFHLLNSVTIDQKLSALEDRTVRQNYSKLTQQWIDGKGADRIADALLAHSLEKAQLFLRLANPDPAGEESRLHWEWRNDPLTRKMSLNEGVITWEGHQAWYRAAQLDPKKTLLMAWQGTHRVGIVRFEALDDDTVEISIAVSPEMRGKHIGKAVLQAGCRYAFQKLNAKKIAADIKNENEPSIRLFESVGFKIDHEKEGVRSYFLKKSIG